MRASSRRTPTRLNPRISAAVPSYDVESAPVTTELRFVSDTQPGIRRYRRGKGYLYTMPASASPSGRQTIIHDADTIARIKALDIPDSWRQVWISPRPDGHLQATGRDSHGRRQSRYHPHWRSFREEKRFEQMLRFSELLPTMRAQVERDIDLSGMPRERVLAILVRLMDSASSGTRGNGHDRKAIGQIESEEPARSQPDTTTWFQINGKGKKHKIDINDPHLNRLVCEYTDLPGFELFQYTDSHGRRARIDCSDINDYVRSSTGAEFTARDFRTWCSSLMAFDLLSQSQVPLAKDEANERVTEAVRHVSHRLSHTPAMCRECLIHPAVIESYLGGTIHHWLNSTNSNSDGKHRHANFFKLAMNERCLYCLLEDYAERSRAPTA